MNDYLGNLVARTLGQMPAVQPRLASRFEVVESPATFGAANARNVAGLFQAHAAETVEVEEEIEAAANRDSTIKPARPPRRVSHAAQTTEDLKPEGDNLVAQVAPKLSIKPAPGQPDILSRAVVQDSEDAPLLLQQPASTLRQNKHAPIHEDTAQTLADQLPAPRRQQTLVPTEARRADSVRQPDKEAQRDIEKPTALLLEGSMRAQPLQPANWQPPPASVAPPFTPPLEREPVIKVTIGRVEVRAVLPTPPASAVTAAEASPRVQALPLNEYLRRRSNGEL